MVFSPLFLQGTIVIGRNDYYQAVIDRAINPVNLPNYLTELIGEIFTNYFTHLTYPI